MVFGRSRRSTEQDREGGEGGPNRTETSDSTSSTSSSSHSSHSVANRFPQPLSKLHQAISRGTESPYSHSNSHHSLTSSHFPTPSTPQQLAELAIATILTIPGPTLSELRTEIFPRLFHEGYSHRANCREHGVEELLQLIERLRGKFVNMRCRFKSNVIDQDGTATMEASAIGLIYDIIATPIHSHEKGQHRRDVEEKRTTVMAICKIFQGKLAQTDIVLDTTPFQEEHTGPQLNQCSIM